MASLPDRKQNKMADYSYKVTLGTKPTNDFSVTVDFMRDIHLENGEKSYSIVTNQNFLIILSSE
jgi:hypothetical protein